jgi:tRNA(fMet)-specific endonuclease VapC
MKLALDTNRYRDFCEGIPSVVEWVREAEILVLPFVVVAELRAGFACGTAAAKNEAVFQRFITRPRVRVRYADEATTHHYARLYRQLRFQGRPIPTHDLWIAAIVLQDDLLLCTRDQHFNALPQIPILTET